MGAFISIFPNQLNWNEGRKEGGRTKNGEFVSSRIISQERGTQKRLKFVIVYSLVISQGGGGGSVSFPILWWACAVHSFTLAQWLWGVENTMRPKCILLYLQFVITFLRDSRKLRPEMSVKERTVEINYDTLVSFCGSFLFASYTTSLQIISFRSYKIYIGGRQVWNFWTGTRVTWVFVCVRGGGGLGSTCQEQPFLISKLFLQLKHRCSLTRTHFYLDNEPRRF